MRAAFLLLLAFPLFAGEFWRMRYFHDKDNEQLRFRAIAFCSPTRGVAVGELISQGKVKPVSVVTANGGVDWVQTPTEEVGYALQFVDETAGWMVTESGVWFTDECGRSWRKILKQKGLTDVRFVSRDRGWVIGSQKTVLETSDGGKTWRPVKAVQDLDVREENTTFHAIEFATPKIGIMTARSSRRHESNVPLWLDPNPEHRRERPTLSVSMETQDGGSTWTATKASMFGRISRIRIAKDGRALGLIEFDDYFEFPSELFRLNTKATQDRAFRRKDFAVTDILLPEGKAYVAGFQPTGNVFRTPVPGKVRIAYSANMADWIEAEVDYRAVATRVQLAAAGDNLWAATDTGMLLERTVTRTQD